MKFFFSFLFICLSLNALTIKNKDGDIVFYIDNNDSDRVSINRALTIKNKDGDIVFYIGGKNNDRVSINCGETIDEDYPLKVCGKILADGFVKDEITLNFKDGDDTISGDEGDKDHDITITLELNKASKDDVTFHFETKDDVAKNSKDYDTVDDDFKIPSGETSIDIKINIIGDETEEKNEPFNIEITKVKNATLDDSTATYTINNDDSTPTLNIETSKSLKENGGDQTLVIRVKLSEKTTKDVTFDFKTHDGSGDNGALDGEDYNAESDNFTIAAGDEYVDIKINIKGDDTYELDDKFTAIISNPSSNAKIGDDTCDIKIDNDDTKPKLSINDLTTKNDDEGDFSITLDKAAGVDVKVTAELKHGGEKADTDTEDKDFSTPDEAGKTSLTISKGDTSVKYHIETEESSSSMMTKEGDEAYQVELSVEEDAAAELDDDNKIGEGLIEDGNA